MNTSPPNETTDQKRPVRRAVWYTIGLMCVALGAIGAVLPVLPTTPFMLLAAACFARSSPRAHRWLLRNRIFGPTIRQWQRTRSIAPQTKVLAILMMTGMIGASLAFGPTHIAVRIFLIASWIGVTVFILRLRTRKLGTEKTATSVCSEITR